jgi:hypothetical protein
MEARRWGCRGAQRREGVLSGVGCRGPECDFADFSRCRPRVLGANGDGAPPPAHIHLNLEVYMSGSPQTKLLTPCNGFVTAVCPLWITYSEHPSVGRVQVRP